MWTAGGVTRLFVCMYVCVVTRLLACMYVCAVSVAFQIPSWLEGQFLLYVGVQLSTGEQTLKGSLPL